MNTPHIYVGMDLHKRTSTLCAKDKEGKIINTKKGREWLALLSLPEPYARSRNQYLETIEQLDKQIERATQDVEKTVGEHTEARLLTTVPGISYITALTIMAEIGDITRFPSAKRLAGYAGLVPSTYR
jgi:transposase